MKFEQYLDEMTSRQAAFSFGSFNPPNQEHVSFTTSLMSQVKNRRDGFIFVDSNTGPLEEADQLKYLRMLVPQMASNIVVNENISNILDIAVWLDQKGYSSIRMVAPAPEIKEARALLVKFNGVEGDHGKYQFQTIQVIAHKTKTDDVTENMISAAVDDNFDAFSAGLPATYIQIKELFEAVKDGLDNEI